MGRHSCVELPQNFRESVRIAIEGAHIKVNNASVSHDGTTRTNNPSRYIQVSKMDVTGIQALRDRYRRTINEKLKQTKPRKHLAPIDLLAFPAEGLCVVKTLEEYLKKTLKHRDKHSQLLLSYIQPFKPVSKDTIARWVKVILKSAGIDVKKYSAHSSSAASTLSSKAKGLSMQKIMAAAGWSNTGTFATYYEKPLIFKARTFVRFC